MNTGGLGGVVGGVVRLRLEVVEAAMEEAAMEEAAMEEAVIILRIEEEAVILRLEVVTKN